MTAVWLRLRVDARTNWRAWLGVSLLVGILTGAAVAAFAGASRTQSSLSRFVRGTDAFDIALTNGSTPQSINRQFDFGEISHLPDVVEAAKVAYYNGIGTTAHGKSFDQNDLAPLAPIEGGFASTINRPRVLHGRLPRGVHEIALSTLAAEVLDARTGDTLRITLTGPSTKGTPEPMTVSGVIAIQGGFPPVTGGLPPLGLLTSDYYRAHPDTYTIYMARLRDGTRGLSAFTRELARLSPNAPIVTSNRIEMTAAVQRGLDVQATALRLLGVVVAVLTILLLGQALARLATLEADDDDVLRELGFVRAQLRTRAVRAGRRDRRGRSRGRDRHRRVALAADAGRRRAASRTASRYGGERRVSRRRAHRRVSLRRRHLRDPRDLDVAAGATDSAGVDARDHRRRVGGVLAAAGASTAAEAGVRMALEPGRGRTSVPVRSTIVSAIVGVAVIAGVLGFSASLRRLLHEPHLYGWNWDIQVGDLFAPDLRPEANRLAARPETEAVSAATIVRLHSGSVLFDTLAIDPLKGSTPPTVVEGRAPSAPDEIMVGTRTLEDLHRKVGDEVEFSAGDRTARLQRRRARRPPGVRRRGPLRRRRGDDLRRRSDGSSGSRRSPT